MTATAAAALPRLLLVAPVAYAFGYTRRRGTYPVACDNALFERSISVAIEDRANKAPTGEAVARTR